MTVEGTNTVMYIASNYAGGGGLDAGTLISTGGTNSNIIIIPNGGGDAGSKVVGSAYNGSAWRSMLEYANVSSGEPVLSLVKTAGNVGIGTTSPLSKLDVSITSTQALFIANESGTISDGDLLGAVSFGSRDGSTYSSGGITNIRSYATATYNTGSVSGDMRFYVSNSLQNTTQAALFGTEAMRITSGGNVLIGTTTDAGTKLNVNGVVNATDYYFNGASSQSVVKRYTA